ncbi:MAG: 50S ribosomal protein L20 [Dehalococcoidia bacterium]|nr:50S ribosomal protein L20 [Dehalococcoidia bacterium]
MPRVKGGVKARRHHKSVLALTKGHRGQRHRLFKRAKESMIHALSYAYAHRRERKGDMRRLWIIRINAACRSFDMPYSRFIEGLTKADIKLNRKVLADLAVKDSVAFSKLVTLAKEKLAAA